MLLSPFIPLLFMGEEYGETAPFQYFVSHSDPALIEAVRRGRREEFAAFAWQGEPPDPQDEATFRRSKLNHDLRREEHTSDPLGALQRTDPASEESCPHWPVSAKTSLEVAAYESERVLFLRRWAGASQVFAAFNFGDAAASRHPCPCRRGSGA